MSEPTPAPPTPPAPPPPGPPGPPRPPGAAAPAPPVNFTAEQNTSIRSLGTILMLVGPLLVIAGIARLVLGLSNVLTTPWAGLFTLIELGVISIEGALVAFAGFAFIAGSTDAVFLSEVKNREKEHLTHTVESVRVGYTALFSFGMLAATMAAIRIFINVWS